MRKNTLILIIFNLINSSTQFIIVIILSRFLTTNDYATFRQLFLPFEVASPLLGLGLSSSIFYFFPRFEKKNRILQIIFCLLFFTCFLFQILLNIGLGDVISNNFQNISLSKYFYLLGTFSFLSIANTILYSYFILINKTNNSLIINFIANTFLIGILLFFVYNDFNLHSIIILRVFIYGLIFALMLFKSDFFKSFDFDFRRFIEDTREIFLYTLPLALSLVVGSLSYKVDKLMVSYLSTPDQYSIYINGAFEVPLISIITTSIAGATFGVFTSYCKDRDFIKANVLFKKVSVISALVLFPCFILLFVYSELIITFLFGVKYSESFLIFRIYAFLLPIRIIQYGNVLIALNKTKTLLLRSIVELIIGFTLGLGLFYLLGNKGIAIGFVLSVLLWTVPYNLVVISRGFKMRLLEILPLRKLFLIIVSCLVGILLIYSFDFLIEGLSDFFKIILITSSFGFLYLIFLYFFNILKIDMNSKYKIRILC